MEPECCLQKHFDFSWSLLVSYDTMAQEISDNDMLCSMGHIFASSFIDRSLYWGSTAWQYNNTLHGRKIFLANYNKDNYRLQLQKLENNNAMKI